MDNALHQVNQRRRRYSEEGAGQYAQFQIANFQNGQQGPPLLSYVPRLNGERLRLIQGDAETFNDVLGLIGEYEGALDRHESLATSLGAKLSGHRILKGFENIFVNPIKQNSPQPSAAPISWLDVLSFAKHNPREFSLTYMPGGGRCCRFTCKGVHVEISEDDWRLISSGALNRLPLEHVFDEDEVAEMATLEILEKRASTLCKKADEVASRARTLHHRIAQRRNDVSWRRNHDSGSSGLQQTVPSGYPSASSSYDLHEDLLQQFLRAPSPPNAARSTSGAGLSATSLGPLSPSLNSPYHHHYNRVSTHSARSLEGTSQDSLAANFSDGRAEMVRSLIRFNVDRLPKGGFIAPPCDRCRRLRISCIKHLSACQGCTKRHSKCSWNTVTNQEKERIEAEAFPDREVDIQTSQDNRDSRLTLESRASLLSSENTSRPASRATADMSIPIVQSPEPLVPLRHELPSRSPRRYFGLPTGVGGISIMHE
ncbi:hypothetical protein QQS21_001403 [Conoideocrella luteorostrata]|uniref:Zn(2)-C6 fungal-type domain-containing protein n=1 Tax=Conoideocrella luteorostrata TaxID=1105319 RepID=A0AAJ0G3G6_9HYPO|nr:hypothetical protein QQS21_001403 [Conoideocrella luteorostrata]